MPERGSRIAYSTVWPENRLANPAALEMWTSWLNAGHRATAVGGSDFHSPEEQTRPDGVVLEGHRIGIPCTYVLATDRTRHAILDALDRRRAYITTGPTIELLAEGPTGPAGIGDDLGPGDGPVILDVSCAGEGFLEVRLVRDGIVMATGKGRGGAGVTARVEPTPQERGWIRVEVYDETGAVIAFTNPIFFGAPAGTGPVGYGTLTGVATAYAIQSRWSEEEEAGAPR